MDCDSERIWKIVENNRQSILPRKRRSLSSQPNLLDRLHDSYVELSCDKIEKGHRFRSPVNVLKCIDSSIATPSLILNLYHDEEGYSIILCTDKGDDRDEICLPYEENYIFHFLDNQQIPPILVEVLKKTKCYHSHEGCIICEVRNYRNSNEGFYNSHFLLLRPTSETLFSTIHEMAQDCECSGEEELFLESRLLLATQSPICLDPSTDVVCVTNRLCYNQRKFNSQSVGRYIQQRSHASRAQKYVVDDIPHLLKVNDFMIQRCSDNDHSHRKFSESWKSTRLKPSHTDCIKQAFEEVSRLAKHIPSVPPTSSPQSDRIRCIDPKLNTSAMQPSVISSPVVNTQSRSQAISSPDESSSLANVEKYTPISSNLEVLYPSSITKVTPPLNPQPHRSVKKYPPPLNIWHPSKSVGQSKLPKLHPFVNDPKIQQSLVQSNKRNSSQSCTTTMNMPQLHKMPTTLNRSSVSFCMDMKPDKLISAHTESLQVFNSSTMKSSKSTSEALKQLVQAHMKLAQSQAELSNPL